MQTYYPLFTAIPLAALGTNAPGAGLRLRVCRNYKLPFVQARDNRAVVYYMLTKHFGKESVYG